MKERTHRLNQWLLLSASVLLAGYCLTIVSVVATAPDPGLRCFLVDGQAIPEFLETAEIQGAVLTQVGWDGSAHDQLAVGDRLMTWDGQPIRSSIDLARQLLAPELRARPFVEIQTYSMASARQQTFNLPLAPAPWSESIFTWSWLLLTLTILGLAGVALWRRPFDRSARVFFGMCLVTMGAFVGGFHWWLLSGSLWLTLPFVICALLVPSATLHFFLVYPRPQAPMMRQPQATLAVLYALPLVGLAWFLLVEGMLWQALGVEDDRSHQLLALQWMQLLRTSVYTELGIAALYFAATMAALIRSVATTRNPLERQQVTWILWAGLIASVFIAYTLVLAYWDRETFARGGARWPMFAAGSLFMAAYAVGMVRFQLFLADAWHARRLWAQGTRWFATAVIAAATAVLAGWFGRWSSGLPVWSGVLLSTAAWIILLAVQIGRDAWMGALDRSFFRERQRADRQTNRRNRLGFPLLEPKFLAERTLVLSREALGSDWAALYLREPGTARFRLSAVEGTVTRLPLDWDVPAPLAARLQTEGTLLPPAGSADAGDAVLAVLGAEAAQGLEADHELAGLLLLGPKRNGSTFSVEDGTFLVTLAQITGVALHGVRLHRDLAQLNEQMRLKIERITQQKQQIAMLQQELSARPTTDESNVVDEDFRRDAIKGNSSSLVRVLETARKVAASDTTVLLRGESGTGKELLARAVHENSPRRRGPLITVHCAALAPGILESELFGHVKGAFTGATADKRGRFELANGGTLFLDEIGEISPETQVKLLRVLQEREIEPVGGSTPQTIDVRLIAATHRPLEQLIREGRFREDLYYRLNVVSLTLPPLRERREDLQELAGCFLQHAAGRIGKRIVDFDDEALDALLRYDWPGNVRELENVVERAVVLAEGELVALSDLPTDIQDGLRNPVVGERREEPGAWGGARQVTGNETDWRRMSPSEERCLLIGALEQTAGNKARAARLLGLPRSTFFSKLKKYALAE